MQLLDRGLQEGLSRRLDRAVLAHLLRSHLGIAGQLGAIEALQLHLPRSLHPLPDGGRGFGAGGAGQLVVLDSGHLDMDVDAIEQGTGEAALVAQDRLLSAGAFLVWIGGEPTGASMRSQTP